MPRRTGPGRGEAVGIIGLFRKGSALDPDYYERLSEDSKRSLTLQGGVFTTAEVQEFLAKPHSDNALRVRRWDDVAKVAGARTRPLAHYLEIAERCAL